jgi:hypothetical protein
MKTKYSIAAVLNLIFLSSVCFADFTPIPSSITHEYLPGAPVLLGQGYFPEAPMSSTPPCLQNIVPIVDGNRTVAQSANVSESVVSSTSGLKETLGIDVEMDASMLTYSGSGKFDYSTETNIDENDLNIVIHGSADYGNDVLDRSKSSYIPDVQKLIASGNLAEFKKECGSQLISSVSYGTRVSVLITLHNMTEEDKSTMGISVSGSGGFGPLSVSAKMNLNHMLQTNTSSHAVTKTVIVRGGDGLPNLATLVSGLQTDGQSIDQIEKGISDIFNGLSPAKAAIVGFTTIPYPGVNWDTEDFISDLKGEALSDLAEAFRYQFGKYSMIHELLLQIDQTGQIPEALQSCAQSLIDEARAEMPTVNNYVEALATAHQNCLVNPDASPSVCPMPARPTTPQFDFLYQLLTH